MLLSLRLSLAVAACGLALGAFGCTNYAESEDAQVDQDELVRVQREGNDIGVLIENESISKTMSFSRDFGSGNTAFAATAIVKTTATFNMKGTLALAPTWNGSLTKLDRLQAKFKGDWNVQGGVDVTFRLSGERSKDKVYVNSVTKSPTKMIDESRVLKSIALKVFKTPIAEVVPQVDLVLSCQATGSTEFDAHATAGIKGTVNAELGWNRQVAQGEVDACGVDGKPKKVQHHWTFASNIPRPTTTAPTFSIDKPEATVTFKCAFMPRLTLEMSLGVKDVLEAGLAAGIEGGPYVAATATGDLQTKTWKAEASVGMKLNAFARLKLVLFCKEVLSDENNYSRALIGPGDQGLELAKKSFSGGFS